MMKRGRALRQSFSNFTRDLENNGIRSAMRTRQSHVIAEPPLVSEDFSTAESVTSPQSSQAPLDASYTLGDHMEYVRVFQDRGGHYFTDSSHLLCDSSILNLVKDYCSPVPLQRLNAVYAGMENSFTAKKAVEGTEAVAVRTMTLRLRPDVMSAVVLDAVQEACEKPQDATAHVLRRHQGHFQCLLMPRSDVFDGVPYMLDANVCTERTGVFARQLVLRFYHAADQQSEQARVADRQKKDRALQMVNMEELMIPLNLHLRGAASFLQYLSKQEQANKPMAIPSPRGSPKACTAFFNASYDPTFSVQLAQQLKHTHSNHLFPSLNSDDWLLLQSSWTLISSLWRSLMEHNCLFNTINDTPLFDADVGENGGAVLDLHYCTQIRQLSRDHMLAELQSSIEDIRTNMEDMEKNYANFTRTLEQTWRRFQMARFQATTKSPPIMPLPSHIPPPGFANLATMACKCADTAAGNPESLCDDAVQKVFKTFCSQDDQNSRKHLKEVNAIVMQRLVEIQHSQMKLVDQLEKHPNTQSAAKEFVKEARLATNSKGRAGQMLLARVPLLDLDIKGGRCQITSTAMLCTYEGVFDSCHSLFDLNAVDFQVISASDLLILSDDETREKLYKLNTRIDALSLVDFLKTLQTLQSVFELEQTDLKRADDDGSELGDDMSFASSTEG